MADVTANRRGGAGRRRTAILAVIAAVPLVAVAVAFVGLGFGAGMPESTLGDRLSQYSDISPVEETEKLCPTDAHCIEGWRTNVGIFLRFDTGDMAEYWKYVIGGDCVNYGNLLLDMNGLDLKQDERRLAIDLLFSQRDWRVVGVR